MTRAFAFAALLALAGQALAVEPDEIMADPDLEARARAISQNLRCMVCQNESIDESNAPLAKDLRIVVRELLAEGSTDEDVYGHLVDRYGEFMLLKPRAEGANWILYLFGPCALALAVFAAAIYIRRNRSRPEARDPDLDADEADRLQRLLE